MPWQRSLFTFAAVTFCTYSSVAQLTDTTYQFSDTNFVLRHAVSSLTLKLEPAENKAPAEVKLKSFLIPAALISYGIASLESHDLRHVNNKVREEIYLENPHRKVGIDDYLQYAPAAAVYALNITGVKGVNNFRDRTIIYLISDIVLNVAVSGGKSLSHELRPDGSNYLSFPSGHTAHAFASAEFLRQEYKNLSPWYGYAGYAVAVATGYLRMYNNRHWLSDVAAGAGVGIASTKVAYWIYPKIKQLFFKKSKSANILLPGYNQGQLSMNFVRQF